MEPYPERIVCVRLDALDKRLAAIERQNDFFLKMAKDNEARDNTLVKLVTSRFNELNTKLQQQNNVDVTSNLFKKNSNSKDWSNDHDVKAKLHFLDGKIEHLSREIEKQNSEIQNLPERLNVCTSHLETLSPHIAQLHKDLSILVKGESDANAVMDVLMPAVSKIEQNVEALSKRQVENTTLIREEVKSCYNKASDAKNYGKDTLIVAESILSKIKRGKSFSSPDNDKEPETKKLLVDRVIPNIYAIRNILEDKVVSESKRERSHSRDRQSESKEQKLLGESEDNCDGGQAEKVGKIFEAVEEIQEKMDSWLKYSKKTMLKSDECTDLIMKKIDQTSENVNTSKNEIGRELLEMKELLENANRSAGSPLEKVQFKTISDKLDSVHSKVSGVTETCLKSIEPKLDDFFENIFPILDEIKKNQRLTSNGEDISGLKKIIEIVEDIRSGEKKGFQPPTLQTDTHSLQILNSLSDIKNFVSEKDKVNAKQLLEVKSKLNEVMKNEKLLPKVCTMVEEVRKNSSSDSGTLSQMNTLIQGLKNSNSAHEKLYCSSIKDVSETVQKLKGPLDECKTLLEKIEDTQDDQIKDFKGFITTKLKGLESPSKRNSSNKTSSEDIIIKSINSLEKKVCDTISSQQSVNSVSNRASVVQSPILDLKSPTLLNDLFENLEEKVTSLCDDHFMKILEEFMKHNGVSSEILNSVEDLKQLTSSMPNAFHDIVPRIEKIEKCVIEIPNDFGALNAAMEENLCVNLETKIKEVHQTTLQDLHQKFETVDQRLAVIKKYAKYGPTVSDKSSNLSSTDSQAPSTLNVNGETLGEMVKEELKYALDRTTSFRSAPELNEIRKTLDIVHAQVKEILSVDKQILNEGAKRDIIDEQFESLADSVLKPVGNIKSRQDKLIRLFETEVKRFLKHSDSFLELSQSRKNQGVKAAQLVKLEKNLSSSFTECRNVLTEVRSCSERTEQNVREIINGEVRKMVADLTDEAFSSKEIEIVTSLVENLKKVQQSQSDIFRQADTSIQYQSGLNEIFRDLLTTVGDVKVMLAERKSKNLESGNLDNFCTDLATRICALDDLEKKFAFPKAQSCKDLESLIRMSVQTLEKLLKKERSSTHVLIKKGLSANRKSRKSAAAVDSSASSVIEGGQEKGLSVNRKSRKSGVDSSASSVIEGGQLEDSPRAGIVPNAPAKRGRKRHATTDNSPLIANKKEKRDVVISVPEPEKEKEIEIIEISEPVKEKKKIVVRKKMVKFGPKKVRADYKDEGELETIDKNSKVDTKQRLFQPKVHIKPEEIAPAKAMFLKYIEEKKKQPFQPTSPISTIAISSTTSRISTNKQQHVRPEQQKLSLISNSSSSPSKSADSPSPPVSKQSPSPLIKSQSLKGPIDSPQRNMSVAVVKTKVNKAIVGDEKITAVENAPHPLVIPLKAKSPPPITLKPKSPPPTTSTPSIKKT